MLRMPGAIYQLKDHKTKRASSFDVTGGNQDFIKFQPGETKTIFEKEGAGIIKHIWITVNCNDPMLRRNAILRMYWDGETEPSVESPLGDFFGQGWGENYNYASLPLAAAPGEGRALNCYFPMPFGKGARFTVENQSDIPIEGFFFYVDYEVHASIPENAGRFHAWWNREITAPEEDIENEWATFGDDYKNTSNKANYLFADIEGKGHFVGVNYFVHNPGPMWYGEGDDMWMVDGEPWPGSLHGTGTEDFFNTSWCPREIYQHPYFGYAKVTTQYGWIGKAHAYRFFIEDPIYFEKSLHASIEHGHANTLTLDLATVAYWYQTEPHKPFPAIPPKDQRQNMPEIWCTDIHRWRHAWRESKGKGKLWGNEK
jgi:hypothetical protein